MRDEREYDINYPCTLDTPQAGVGDVPDSSRPLIWAAAAPSSTARYNPSNTGNIRV